MPKRPTEVTKIHPITQRDGDVVMAWIFTLTLRDGERQVMDTITVPIEPPESRKTLARWTRKDVDALVAAALKSHPKIAALHRVLDRRLAIHEHVDFDVDTLP